MRAPPGAPVLPLRFRAGTPAQNQDGDRTAIGARHTPLTGLVATYLLIAALDDLSKFLPACRFPQAVDQ